MSRKGITNVSSPLPWDECMRLIKGLYEKGDISLSLFVAISVNTGLKGGDVRKMRWSDILLADFVESNGIKVKISDKLKIFAKKCYDASGAENIHSRCVISQKKTTFSMQRINIILKDLKEEYNLHCENFSTMSFRKSFGIQYLSTTSHFYGGLSLLQNYFGHAYLAITCEFLGLGSDFLKSSDDFIAIPNFEPVPFSEDELSELTPKKNDGGYCYIMKNDLFPGIYKLGKSKHPSYRQKTLLHDAPSISLFKVVETENMSKLEKEMHLLYENERLNGEWFKLTEEQVDSLISRYNFVDYKTNEEVLEKKFSEA
jgi:hypothetical protein